MREVWPWSSRRERAESIILGRQVLTLMAMALLVAVGLLVDIGGWGYRLAWYAFEAGAVWVSFVELGDRADPPPPWGGGRVREPWDPAPDPLGPLDPPDPPDPLHAFFADAQALLGPQADVEFGRPRDGRQER